MSFFEEFLDFLMTRKKYWLMPVMLIVAILGGLIVLAQGSTVAPFIYALF